MNILEMREDFRVLWLIDVSIIAIHASGGGGGGGGQLETDPFNCDVT